MTQRRYSASIVGTGLDGAFTPLSATKSKKHRSRHCERRSCLVVLSRYNDGRYCALHAPARIQPICVMPGDRST